MQEHSLWDPNLKKGPILKAYMKVIAHKKGMSAWGTDLEDTCQ